MAIKKHYSMLDTMAQVFLNPISFTNDGDAIRWFTTMINGNKEESNIARYPNQFILYRINDFDDKRGLYLETMDDKELTHPKELITGTNVVEPKNQTFTMDMLIKELEDYYDKKNVVDIKEAKN